MSKTWDAIVVGGGHNGLTTSARLAKGGLDVLCLEKRHVLGGAAVTEEVVPGFKFSVCSYVVSLLRPEVIRALELTRHGLQVLPMDCTFTPYPDGRYLARWSDSHKTREEVSKFSLRDAEAIPEFGRAMVELCRFVQPILDMTPPEPHKLSLDALGKALTMGRRFKALSAGGRFDLVKLMTMSAVEFLEHWFESDEMIAASSVSGIIGTYLGVRSPGTAYVLLHHYMGEIDGAYRAWGFAKGGMGAVSNSIASAAREAGATIRTEAGVQRILINGDRAVGVVLDDGEEIYARTVISGLEPKLTMLGLVGESHLPSEYTAHLNRFKLRGSSGKLNLALDSAPIFKALPEVGPHLAGDITIAPSVNYLERAYDEAKYGHWSKRPFIDIVVPSMLDPTVAPPGKHVMSCFIQYAPYHLNDELQAAGGWDATKDAWVESVIDTIEEYVPNIRDIIIDKQALTPLDLEREFGLTEGNIFHGELTQEQLFFLRPVPGWSKFRTPVRNLYMCASGVHPGGGVMAAPGWVAGREILEDFKHKRVGS